MTSATMSRVPSTLKLSLTTISMRSSSIAVSVRRVERKVSPRLRVGTMTVISIAPALDGGFDTVTPLRRAGQQAAKARKRSFEGRGGGGESEAGRGDDEQTLADPAQHRFDRHQPRRAEHGKRGEGGRGEAAQIPAALLAVEDAAEHDRRDNQQIEKVQEGPDRGG